ncbi:MAG: RIP metalloprotease RseP [Acidobacteria bacterium]|nr:RIP metalloprotease RseP [Acidobacteriota bacterium]
MESVINIGFYYILIPLIVLGIAVNIHEFGHFIIAKMFGMRVEAYSFFGLGPRIWGFRRGHTDYRISAIPLGAYVKLYGDESNAGLEGKDEAGEQVPASELYELRPRWQKLLVMLGGPFMNLVLALSIPFATAYVQGIPSMPAPIVGKVLADGPAAQAGLQVGDRIVSFNGIEDPTWRNVDIEVSVNAERPLPAVIERNGQRMTLQVTPRREKIFAGQYVGTIDADPDLGALPVIVGDITPNTPAAEAGLQSGDRIVAVNGETVRDASQTKEFIEKGKAAPINLSIEREGKPISLTATVRKLDDGTERLGFGFKRTNLPLEPATLTSAASYAFTTNIETIKTTGSILGQVFAGNRSVKDSGIGGPIGIFQQSAEATRIMGIDGFFIILTGISLSLGLFNLLPIPMLDGGQIAVLGVEKVMSWFGRTLSMVAKERIQLTGLAIVLLLMVTVIFFDVSRLVGK